MNNRIGYIYIIKNIFNDKVYVGQTVVSVQKRFNRHLSDKKQDCPKLYNALNKYGRENFYVEHIASAKIQLDLDFLENYFIKYYDSINKGYNLREGGSHGALSEEDKLKKSIAAKKRWDKVKQESIKFGISHPMAGENNVMFGKTHSSEAKAKISLARTGKGTSLEVRLKMSKLFSGENNPMYGVPSPMKGKHLSLESIDKMKESKRKPERDFNIINMYLENKTIANIVKSLNVPKTTVFRVIKNNICKLKEDI